MTERICGRVERARWLGAVLVLAGVIAAPESAIAQSSTAAHNGIKASPALVTIASALVPGAGQAIMHQKRSLAYLLLEAAGVSFYIRESRDGARQRNMYRDISQTVARAPFSPSGPEGDWDYYERMEKYVSSGIFDAVPGGQIDPEPDASTYNGSMWLLARETFWRDPDRPPATGTEEYQAALRFYSDRAITPEFRWSWLGAPEAFQKYRAGIAASNSSFRSAEKTVSLLIANHLLSAVDAYVSVNARVRRHADGSLWFTVSHALPWAGQP